MVVRLTLRWRLIGAGPVSMCSAPSEISSSTTCGVQTSQAANSVGTSATAVNGSPMAHCSPRRRRGGRKTSESVSEPFME
jgi:hypothetical protein